MPATTAPPRTLGQAPEMSPRRPLAVAVAVAVCVGAWLANAADRLGRAVPDPDHTVTWTLLAVDAALGLAALVLLRLRHRRAFAVSAVATGLIVVSAASLGPAVVGLFTLAGQRRRAGVVGVGLVFLGSQVLGQVLLRTTVLATEGTLADRAGSLLVGLLVLAIPVAVGYSVSARGELIASLQERARTAEREQLLIGEAAREAERTRIAREMHDVLAHRISLVALHAGALGYREDLTREETAATAATIQQNAQLALAELRQVLGVLRGTDRPGEPEAVDEPQPTLAELPALLADAREAGMVVRLDGDLAGPKEAGADAMPTGLSRTAFRIIQEALTNARKHAPGALVTVRLDGEPGGDLVVEVLNALAPDTAAGTAPAGMGLLGLRERAELAGGSLSHGPSASGTFVVKAVLPWSP